MKKIFQSERHSRGYSRREFIRTTTGLAAGLALGGGGISSVLAAPRNKKLPTPNKSDIEHVVVVTMENRSFDHFLGWLPGANGKQAGLTYFDKNGVAHSTAPLAPDYQGCIYSDPDHSYQGARIEFNNGACDGWLKAGSNDDFSIGYYVESDLPFLGNAAQSWTACDNYFSAIMAPTYPNRIYLHSAQTDRLDDSILPLSTLPTIWDRLADHSLSRRYYFTDFPFLALWGTRYAGISSLITDFFSDCAAGTLPAVSYVDPGLLGESQGLSNDDHPHADIRNGEVFLNAVYQAVTSSPNWANTVLIITFDEWGGFFDHVAPTKAPIPSTDAALGSDGLRGFRVPTLVISPWSPRGTIAKGLYDHTSVLKLIEWRWNLRPLTVRDSNANNLAEALDFSRSNLSAPVFPVPTGVFGDLCLNAAVATSADVSLLDRAARLGFPTPR